MDDNGLPAESATAISRLVLILFLLIHNIFTLSKKQKNAMSGRKTTIFQHMVVNAMELLIFCYLRKYTD